jgi:hypothetical protein
VVGGGVAPCDYLGRDALRLGGGHDLVVDVGDVAHIENVAEAVLQQPEQHVEHNRRARIADMRVIVHCGPAYIHSRPAGIRRGERLLAPGEGIIELHRMRLSLASFT